MEFTKLDYCQYLLSSQVNYTLTNLAEHLDQFSHDTINRYLKGEKLSPRLLFEQAEELLERDPDAYLIFDDTVLEKSYGPEIEPTRYQWSGNAKDVIRGIGVVSLVYVNPKTEHFWVIDYRIFDPDTDGLTKIDHVRQMLGSVAHRRLPYSTVLMDTWYATKELMMLVERMGKTFYCPLKANRSVDDSGAQRPYRRVDSLEWSEQELELGKLVKVKDFPGDYKLKLSQPSLSGADDGLGAVCEVLLTLWLSTIPALGWRSLPRRTRNRLEVLSKDASMFVKVPKTSNSSAMT